MDNTVGKHAPLARISLPPARPPPRASPSSPTLGTGMGIDKSSVRYVVHFDPPASLEGFYQGSGRWARPAAPASPAPPLRCPASWRGPYQLSSSRTPGIGSGHSGGNPRGLEPGTERASGGAQAKPAIRAEHPFTAASLACLPPCPLRSGGRDGEPCLSLLYASNKELQDARKMERGPRQGAVGAVAAYIQAGCPHLPRLHAGRCRLGAGPSLPEVCTCRSHGLLLHRATPACPALAPTGLTPGGPGCAAHAVQEPRCRRRALLSHFGEKRAGGCQPGDGEQVLVLARCGQLAPAPA